MDRSARPLPPQPHPHAVPCGTRSTLSARPTGKCVRTACVRCVCARVRVRLASAGVLLCVPSSIPHRGVCTPAARQAAGDLGVHFAPLQSACCNVVCNDIRPVLFFVPRVVQGTGGQAQVGCSGRRAGMIRRDAQRPASYAEGRPWRSPDPAAPTDWADLACARAARWGDIACAWTAVAWGS